ncbi:MAG TPA: 1-acyl-sn-glycerol-3-phosphate acyltransferase [Thermoanaerobaculia bacterium]
MGAHLVPDATPVIFAVNHPNGLIDPLFLLAFLPRRVSFLAKAPLFTMPLIGYFVRAFESVPVYRKQDNVAGTHAETFAKARQILGSGGAIALFPEGTTHSDPRLREFKTGAARIALGSALPELAIVPAGIYYTEKQTFRSQALIAFGEPIRVSGMRVDGEPPTEAVIDLTDKIEASLATLTLQADSHTALELIAKAEDIFSSDPDQPLVEELELRRRFIAGYHLLREQDEVRLRRVESEIRRFEAELGRAGLEPHELRPRIAAGAIARIVLLLPIAIIGMVAHYIPYLIIDVLSRRFSRGASELTATVKFVAALALYPLTWIAISIGAWLVADARFAVAALLLLPITGYVALRMLEATDDVVGRIGAVFHRLFKRDAHEALVERRRAIRREIAELAEELDVVAARRA